MQFCKKIACLTMAWSQHPVTLTLVSMWLMLQKSAVRQKFRGRPSDTTSSWNKLHACIVTVSSAQIWFVSSTLVPKPLPCSWLLSNQCTKYLKGWTLYITFMLTIILSVHIIVGIYTKPCVIIDLLFTGLLPWLCLFCNTTKLQSNYAPCICLPRTHDVDLIKCLHLYVLQSK